MAEEPTQSRTERYDEARNDRLRKRTATRARNSVEYWGPKVVEGLTRMTEALTDSFNAGNTDAWPDAGLLLGTDGLPTPWPWRLVEGDLVWVLAAPDIDPDRLVDSVSRGPATSDDEEY